MNDTPEQDDELYPVELHEISRDQLSLVVDGTTILLWSLTRTAVVTREAYVCSHPEGTFWAWEWSDLFAEDGPQESILLSTEDLLRRMDYARRQDDDPLRIYVVVNNLDPGPFLSTQAAHEHPDPYLEDD